MELVTLIRKCGLVVDEKGRVNEIDLELTIENSIEDLEYDYVNGKKVFYL